MLQLGHRRVGYIGGIVSLLLMAAFIVIDPNTVRRIVRTAAANRATWTSSR